MAETEEKPKKQGFLSKFLEFLLEEDEDEADDLIDNDAGDLGMSLDNISDENKQLLAELKEEDKLNAKKKEKKEKKGKKGKKKGEEDEGEGEEGAEEKKKKPKKEKKKKEKKVEEEPQTQEKKLSKKKVTSVFMFCTTLAVCIIVITILLPVQFEKQEARVAYDHNQYEQVYDMLYGKKLSEEDEILLNKSSIILQVKRKVDSYENYQKMGMPLEALNALLEGMRRYNNLIDDAEMYRINGELMELYNQILDALADSYGISESEALDIISSGDNVTYSQKIEAIVYGDTFGADEETVPQGKQDVLPEEEEIIDRLENTEESGEATDSDALQDELTPEFDDEMIYDEEVMDL